MYASSVKILILLLFAKCRLIKEVDVYINVKAQTYHVSSEILTALHADLSMA